MKILPRGAQSLEHCPVPSDQSIVENASIFPIEHKHMLAQVPPFPSVISTCYITRQALT